MKIKFLLLLLLIVSSSYAQKTVSFVSDYTRTGIYNDTDLEFNSWRLSVNTIKFSNNEITISNSKDTLVVITEPENLSDRDDVGMWYGKANGKSVLVMFIINEQLKVAYLSIIYINSNNLVQYKFTQQSKQ
jgi:hypothetical protein